MGLFALNAVPDLPLLPVVGSVSGSDLTGFTQTRIPFGNATGGLEDSVSLTFDANSVIMMRSLGVNTTAPSFQCEINNASGNNLRLTYNDNNGSPANYVDFMTTAAGNLVVAPSSSVVHIDATVEYLTPYEYDVTEIW